MAQKTVLIQNVLHVGRLGAAIFNGKLPDGTVRRFVADTLPRPPVSGEAWEIGGVIKRHPKYGPQVHVRSATLVRPSGRLVTSLLAGTRFPGVGPVAARRLWEHFGEALYEVLDRADGTAISEALGSTRRAQEQAEVIITVWPTITAEPSVLCWLDRHGFPPHLAHKLIHCYGPEVITKLEANPYRMVAFAPWSTVDQAARGMGFGQADERRLVAACEAALYLRLNRSHTWTADATLRGLVAGLLGASDEVGTAIDLAAEDEAIIAVEGGWQPLGPVAMETYVAERIGALLSGSDGLASQPQLFHRSVSELLAAGWLQRWQAAHGMALNDRQQEAVHAALTCPISLLLGGAGVGKTTVLHAICDLAHDLGINLHLMALSGRAALRITEATGRPARTIAGFLQRATTGQLALDDEPLIVVDEASMVDLTSLYRIMRLCPPGCRFLLVGDPGQLPPVSFGITLHALAGSTSIPKVELVEVMRQAAATGIPAAAAAVRQGAVPHFDAYASTHDHGISFVQCHRAEMVSTVLDICASLGGKGHQIIGSTKGLGVPEDGGIRAINNAMHAAYRHGKATLLGGYAVGEPVIWGANDYDLHIFNGTLGKVVREDGNGADRNLIVDFDGVEKRIPFHLLGNLELAWAITTHKAQGSQFETVIMPITRNRLLDRTLLYTAITRAKRLVVLVGDLAAFEAAVAAEPSSSRRQTGLSHALDRYLAAIFAGSGISNSTGCWP